MRKPRMLVAAMLVAAAFQTACSNSGLGAYNKDNEDGVPPESTEDPLDNVLPLDECGSICFDQSLIYAYLGCAVSCVENVAPSFDANLFIFTFPVVIDAGFSWEGGGSCNTKIDCSQMSVCSQRALADLVATNDTDKSQETYDNCELEIQCTAVSDSCIQDAEDTLDLCQSNPAYTLQQCQDLHQDDLAFCTCLYSSCMNETNGEECLNASPPPMPPMPQQTAPSHFTVTRRLIDYEVGRAMILYKETTLTPLHNKTTGAWIGLRIGSIEQGDVLYRLGLRDNDVLISANGMAIQDPTKPFGSWLQLRSAAQINLVIKRQGQNRTLVYTLTD